MFKKEYHFYPLLTLQLVAELMLAGIPGQAIAASPDCTTDPECSHQWHLGEQGTNWLDLYTRISQSEINLEPVTIALLDSGIQSDHQDLPEISEASCGVIGQYSKPLECASVNDENGHGTAVAGQILGISNNEKHGAGVLPELIKESVIIKVMLPSGIVNYSDMYTGLEYLISLVNKGKKIDVVVMSIAGDPLAYISVAEQNLIERIKVQLTQLAEAGVIVVAGAGNDLGEPTHFPANQPTVIDVGASTQEGKKAVFSSAGSKEGATWQILAPGVEIGTTCIINDFCFSNGTSISTPQVAQAVSIIKSKYPRATVEEVKELLYTSSRSTSSTIEGETLEFRILDFKKLGNELGIPELNEEVFKTRLPSIKSVY